MLTPKEKVLEKYGAPVVKQIEEVWTSFAKPQNDQARIHMDYFLQRGEESPQGEGCIKCKDDKEENLLHMVYKLVLYAPVEWFDVVTKEGVAKPDGVANDFKNIGVAFDASSRLRRAGITYYHEELSKKSCGHDKGEVYYIGPAGPAGATGTFVPAQDGLPQQQKDVVRVVAIGCTHLFTNHITLPRSGGDVLVHAGDLGYEESRSLWEEKWRHFLAQPGNNLLTVKAVKTWIEKEKVPLGDSLKWLQSVPGFRDKVMIGGNHDYILEQLDEKGIAVELCEKYGLTYLRTQDQPKRLNCSQLVVWGSGLSAMSQVGDGRAIVSGNCAYQHNVKDEAGFRQKTKHLHEQYQGPKPHLLVMHGPPCTSCLGKEGKDLPGVTSLVELMKPKVFVCSHAHNPSLEDLTKGRHTTAGETLTVNAACLGTWNHAHGTPVVVDLKMPEVVNSRSCVSEGCWRLEQFFALCRGS